MEPKWGLWQHTRFLRTKMWASNVGGGACLASFAISQQPLPWLSASPPPPTPSGTAKRIRIKRETCFSLASCSGPMTSPLQPPAPRFQPPSTFFPFTVDPPFYLNSTILYLFRKQTLYFRTGWFHVRASVHLLQGANLDVQRAHSEKSIKPNQTNISLKKKKEEEEEKKKETGSSYYDRWMLWCYISFF